MRRILRAARNSARAIDHLLRNEAAFRQELIVLAAGVPVGWFLARSWAGYALLLASLLLVILVEVLNSAIEAACNALSREFSPDIRIAKDCGSLAVAIALLVAACVWLAALWGWWSSLPG